MSVDQGLVTVDFVHPRREKHREVIKTVLKAAHNSHKLQICRKRILKLEEGSVERDLIADEINTLAPLVDNGFKYFFAGGSIRAGKTYLFLTLICTLAGLYSGSKWIIVRKSYDVLKKTTIPSIQKILLHSEGLFWKQSGQEYYVQLPNGSRIYFVSEGYDSDKHLTKFLGLEINGALLEQLEELQKETYDMVKTRLGSWNGMGYTNPPPFLFATFNPTHTWLKKEIYDVWKKGNLKSPYYFKELLPSDNPDVTEEQWQNWRNLPPDVQARLIKGEWEVEVKGQFCSSFDTAKHVAEADFEIDWKYDIVLSFDFNVDPMTATLSQTDYRSFIRVIREFRIPNSDTFEMCETIKPIIQGREHTVVITGDASGKNRISGIKGHINHYQIIKEQLGINSWEQFKVPSVNPFISDSRVFINALLYRLPEFKFSPSCVATIEDMRFVVCDINRQGDMEIKKTGLNPHLGVDNKTLGHLLDTIRYMAHATFTDWLEIPKS